MNACTNPHDSKLLFARWQAARATFLREIAEIDAATPWSPTEPDWWLEMMAAQRAVVRSGEGA